MLPFFLVRTHCVYLSFLTMANKNLTLKKALAGLSLLALSVHFDKR